MKVLKQKNGSFRLIADNDDENVAICIIQELNEVAMDAMRNLYGTRGAEKICNSCGSYEGELVAVESDGENMLSLEDAEAQFNFCTIPGEKFLPIEYGCE